MIFARDTRYSPVLISFPAIAAAVGGIDKAVGQFSSIKGQLRGRGYG